MVNNLAWICAVGPGGLDDYAAPIRRMERAVAESPSGPVRHIYLNTLGALLYRAGRPREAIEAITRGMQADGGGGVAQDWAFLAMAHQALGDPPAAARWLAKLEARTRDPDLKAIWDELEIRLLAGEARARVGLDPVFPDDPFAR